MNQTKWEKIESLLNAYLLQMRKREVVVFVNSDWVAKRLSSRYPSLKIKVVSAETVKAEAEILRDQLGAYSPSYDSTKKPKIEKKEKK